MLNGWDGVLGFKSAFFPFQTWQVKLILKSSILVSSDHSTFSQPSSESSRCLFANFRRACTCALLSRGTLQALHDFSPLQCNLLQMAILVTVVPVALRSLTSSCHLVLGCSLTFFIIRFTPRWEILCGAPDQERLIVNWCFFHFLIITPTVDYFSLSCLPCLVAHSSLVRVYNLVPDVLRQFFCLAHCGVIRFWFIEGFCELVSFIQVISTWLGVIIE